MWTVATGVAAPVRDVQPDRAAMARTATKGVAHRMLPIVTCLLFCALPPGPVAHICHQRSHEMGSASSTLPYEWTHCGWWRHGRWTIPLSASSSSVPDVTGPRPSVLRIDRSPGRR